MDVLISGAGIAGPNLAWWLARGGHRPVIVERAEMLRTGGYIIDFWGKGYDLAERMGLLPGLRDRGYFVQEVRMVGEDGLRRGGFGGDVFRRLTDGRFVSLPRSELSHALFDAVKDDAECLFGDSVASIAQDADGADVTFDHGPPRRFDLVIGAEGIHSRTRDLVFGPQERFETYLGYLFAAVVLKDYPRRDPDAYIMYNEPGRQAARFSLRDGSTLVLLIWREDDIAAYPHAGEGQRALVRERFSGCGWEVPQILSATAEADDFYLDRVSQIRMDRWHSGRVALVGDAAFAPSFLAGQGSALAMIGGYVLAKEIERAQGDLPRAFKAWEKRLMPFMQRKQDAAARFASSFVPASRTGIVLRNLFTRAMGIGWIADLLLGRDIRDQIELPD